MSYWVPKTLACNEIVIKKSRFIALAHKVESRQAAMQWLTTVKTDYPDARHHCWAYQLGHPKCATNAGMGDDGEPSGTAGKPILNVLSHKNVGDIMVIVVRHYGGIKLGAGGLTRAYSQATQAVMEILQVAQRIEQTTLKISVPFALEQQVRFWLDTLNGAILQVDYDTQVALRVAIPQAELQELTGLLTANQCQFQIL